MKVSDVMERDLAAISANATMADAVVTLFAHATSGLPVLDDDGRVVGFLSEKDVLSAAIPGYIGYMDETFAMPDTDKIKQHIKKGGKLRVADHMTKEPITFEEDDDLDAAIIAIFKKNIHRAPVVRDGMLVGIVGRAHVLRGFIQANIDDEEAARAR